MDASEELELVPPEYRHEHKPKVHMASSDLPIMRSSGPQLEDSLIPRTGKISVYITFYTDSDKKVIRYELEPRDSLDELTSKANELFPENKWRLFSGTQYCADYELLNGKMVLEAVKTTHHYDFHYLLIHLKPVDAAFVTCDSCRQSIHGHRFKCTECADFDICGRCEARSVHSEHAMLRIVNSGTLVPLYITENAPTVYGLGFLLSRCPVSP